MEHERNQTETTASVGAGSELSGIVSQHICYIDGDFRSYKGTCEFHCSPSCHPAQVGPDWKYGCTHKAWPSNRYGDFVPIVECDGDQRRCDMRGQRFLSGYKRGLHVRLRNAAKKIELLNRMIAEIDGLAG